MRLRTGDAATGGGHGGQGHSELKGIALHAIRKVQGAVYNTKIQSGTRQGAKSVEERAVRRRPARFGLEGTLPVKG